MFAQVLTSLSARTIRYIGAGGITVTLPAVVTLTEGFYFELINDSAGIVTVLASNNATVTVLSNGTLGESVKIWCDDTTAVGPVAWVYRKFSTLV